MKHKHLLRNGIYTFPGIILFLVCCILTLPKTTSGKDSTVRNSFVKISIKETADNKNVYTDSNYFKNIPVEKSTNSMAQGVVQKSFASIHSKYNSPEFDYKENPINRLSWWDRLKHRVEDFLDNLFPAFRWNLSRAVYYILIGLGLAVLIYVVFKLTTSGKKISFREESEASESTPSWIEKKLTEINLQTYLEQALSDKNFMLAVRYLHLINLKKLALTGQIEWNYQKTNHEFLRELKSKNLSSDFAKTIRIYEYIWYGKFSVGEEKFGEYQQLFQQFNQEIA